MKFIKPAWIYLIIFEEQQYALCVLVKNEQSSSHDGLFDPLPIPIEVNLEVCWPNMC